MADNRIHRLQYEKMVESALRNVVREALGITARQGLPGAHHFYITFRTRYPGVDIARHLVERHPDEMTIVLQNQFWGLDVEGDGFAVTLSFNKVNERLQVPFAAVTAFADPSAKFGLQFNVDTSVEVPLREPVDDRPPVPDPAADGAASPGDEGAQTAAESRGDGNAKGDTGGNVIALDAFRKK